MSADSSGREQEAAGREASARRGRKLVSDSVLTTVTEAGSAVITLLSGVLISRYLGPSGRGIYAVVILIPMTLQQLGMLGIPLGTVHYMVKDPAGRGRRAANTFVAAVLTGVPLACVGWLALHRNVLEEYRQATPLVETLIALGIPAVLFTSYVQGVVLGLDDLRKRNALRIFELTCYLGGVLVLVVWLRQGIEGAVMAWAAGVIGAASLALLFVSPVAAAARFRPDWSRLRQDVTFGLQGYFAYVGFFLLYRSDQYLVAHFLDSTAVGHYSVAASLTMMLGILPAAVEQAFVPKVTAAYLESGGREDLTPFVCRVTFVISGIAAIFAGVLAYPLIGLVYGEAFLPAAAPFVVLLPACTIVAGLFPIMSAMQARFEQRWVSLGAVVGIVSNILLNLVMIPRWGIVGAAAASSISYLIYGGIALYAFVQVDERVSVRDVIVPTMKDVRAVIVGAKMLVGLA